MESVYSEAGMEWRLPPSMARRPIAVQYPAASWSFSHEGPVNTAMFPASRGYPRTSRFPMRRS